MAKSKVSKAYIRRGKGKLSGRHCVIAETGKRAPGFKGKGSTKRMYGCFTKLADAQKRVAKLSK